MKTFLIVAALLASNIAFADEDIKAEILNRCRKDMGDYGSALVKVCVDEDIKAVNALSEVPEKYKPILARCLRDMRKYGYSLVKVCVDQDVEAEKALERY